MKVSYLGRSGVVGVKAWVHFQKPRLEDLLGRHLNGENISIPNNDILDFENDYDEKKVDDYFKNLTEEKNDIPGLWHANSSENRLVNNLVSKMEDLHTPIDGENCRFLW